ncbi:hypothetical protein D4Z93_09020 [Clostridium fermenticellae]|uniref:Uncharacterized protein n=1 Tax=Clostridium fermenticellae TaxID=2068654 RepID=A0A386H554_9CLOT|nr:hypothetical protein [Clostridium fermenticellae]AYD40663.1 hypothetical protein D4Z93_09020 [Clostridium fermenticellae]
MRRDKNNSKTCPMMHNMKTKGMMMCPMMGGSQQQMSNSMYNNSMMYEEDMEMMGCPMMHQTMTMCPMMMQMQMMNCYNNRPMCGMKNACDMDNIKMRTVDASDIED